MSVVWLVKGGGCPADIYTESRRASPAASNDRTARRIEVVTMGKRRSGRGLETGKAKISGS
jgi:hypothetical protein